MRLVTNWKSFYRYYSNISHTLQVAMITGWMNLPQDWKAAIPPKILITVSGIVWGLGVFGSIVSQGNKNDGN